MNRPDVYVKIDQERDYQDERWGGKSHDETHTLGDWILLMEGRLADARTAFCKGQTADAIHLVRQTTAIGVAALEVLE